MKGEAQVAAAGGSMNFGKTAPNGIFADMDFYDIIIIGGGASGMCTAINAKTKNTSVLLIDAHQRPGRKLLATGNGRCNLTNEYCTYSLLNKNPEGIYPFFSEGKREFIENVIKRYDCSCACSFFEGMNLFLISRNGYVYPKTEQASTVLEMLEKKVKDLGIAVKPACRVREVFKRNGSFIVNNEYAAKSLVLACGGLSSPKGDEDGSGYKIASAFGHSILKPRPALCGIACRGAFFRDISAARQDGVLTLYAGTGSPLMKCSGNIQFTNYGISGIPAFQLSSEAGRLLEKNIKPEIEIDLFPGMPAKKIADIIKDRKENFLLGIVNSSIAAGYEKILCKEGLKKGSSTYINSLSKLVRSLRVEVQALPSFKNSQVTAGGIPTWEINAGTMESLKTRGLYFTGEIMDVNGICGGYNLQWAWSTAFICAESLREKHDKDFGHMYKT